MQDVRIKLERFSSGGVWQGGQGDNEKKSRPIKNGVGGLASTCSLAWYRRNQKEGQRALEFQVVGQLGLGLAMTMSRRAPRPSSIKLVEVPAVLC